MTKKKRKFIFLSLGAIGGIVGLSALTLTIPHLNSRIIAKNSNIATNFADLNLSVKQVEELKKYFKKLDHVKDNTAKNRLFNQINNYLTNNVILKNQDELKNQISYRTMVKYDLSLSQPTILGFDKNVQKLIYNQILQYQKDKTKEIFKIDSKSEVLDQVKLNMFTQEVQKGLFLTKKQFTNDILTPLSKNNDVIKTILNNEDYIDQIYIDYARMPIYVPLFNYVNDWVLDHYNDIKKVYLEDTFFKKLLSQSDSSQSVILQNDIINGLLNRAFGMLVRDFLKFDINMTPSQIKTFWTNDLKVNVFSIKLTNYASFMSKETYEAISNFVTNLKTSPKEYEEILKTYNLTKETPVETVINTLVANIGDRVWSVCNAAANGIFKEQDGAWSQDILQEKYKNFSNDIYTYYNKEVQIINSDFKVSSFSLLGKKVTNNDYTLNYTGTKTFAGGLGSDSLKTLISPTPISSLVSDQYLDEDHTIPFTKFAALFINTDKDIKLHYDNTLKGYTDDKQTILINLPDNLVNILSGKDTKIDLKYYSSTYGQNVNLDVDKTKYEKYGNADTTSFEENTSLTLDSKIKDFSIVNQKLHHLIYNGDEDIIASNKVKVKKTRLFTDFQIGGGAIKHGISEHNIQGTNIPEIHNIEPYNKKLYTIKPIEYTSPKFWTVTENDYWSNIHGWAPSDESAIGKVYKSYSKRGTNDAVKFNSIWRLFNTCRLYLIPNSNLVIVTIFNPEAEEYITIPYYIDGQEDINTWLEEESGIFYNTKLTFKNSDLLKYVSIFLHMSNFTQGERMLSYYETWDVQLKGFINLFLKNNLNTFELNNIENTLKLYQKKDKLTPFGSIQNKVVEFSKKILIGNMTKDESYAKNYWKLYKYLNANIIPDASDDKVVYLNYENLKTNLKDLKTLSGYMEDYLSNPENKANDILENVNKNKDSYLWDNKNPANYIRNEDNTNPTEEDKEKNKIKTINDFYKLNPTVFKSPINSFNILPENILPNNQNYISQQSGITKISYYDKTDKHFNALVNLYDRNMEISDVYNLFQTNLNNSLDKTTQYIPWIWSVKLGNIRFEGQASEKWQDGITPLYTYVFTYGENNSLTMRVYLDHIISSDEYFVLTPPKRQYSNEDDSFSVANIAGNGNIFIPNQNTDPKTQPEYLTRYFVMELTSYKQTQIDIDLNAISIPNDYKQFTTFGSKSWATSLKNVLQLFIENSYSYSLDYKLKYQKTNNYNDKDEYYNIWSDMKQYLKRNKDIPRNPLSSSFNSGLFDKYKWNLNSKADNLKNLWDSINAYLNSSGEISDSITFGNMLKQLTIFKKYLRDNIDSSYIYPCRYYDYAKYSRDNIFGTTLSSSFNQSILDVFIYATDFSTEYGSYYSREYKNYIPYHYNKQMEINNKLILQDTFNFINPDILNKIKENKGSSSNEINNSYYLPNKTYDFKQNDDSFYNLENVNLKYIGKNDNLKYIYDFSKPELNFTYDITSLGDLVYWVNNMRNGVMKIGDTLYKVDINNSGITDIENSALFKIFDQALEYSKLKTDIQLTTEYNSYHVFSQIKDFFDTVLVKPENDNTKKYESCHDLIYKMFLVWVQHDTYRRHYDKETYTYYTNELNIEEDRWEFTHPLYETIKNLTTKDIENALLDYLNPALDSKTLQNRIASLNNFLMKFISPLHGDKYGRPTNWVKWDKSSSSTSPSSLLTYSVKLIPLKQYDLSNKELFIKDGKLTSDAKKWSTYRNFNKEYADKIIQSYINKVAAFFKENGIPYNNKYDKKYFTEHLLHNFKWDDDISKFKNFKEFIKLQNYDQSVIENRFNEVIKVDLSKFFQQITITNNLRREINDLQLTMNMAKEKQRDILKNLTNEQKIDLVKTLDKKIGFELISDLEKSNIIINTTGYITENYTENEYLNIDFSKISQYEELIKNKDNIWEYLTKKYQNIQNNLEKYQVISKTIADLKNWIISTCDSWEEIKQSLSLPFYKDLRYGGYQSTPHWESQTKIFLPYDRNTGINYVILKSRKENQYLDFNNTIKEIGFDTSIFEKLIKSATKLVKYENDLTETIDLTKKGVKWNPYEHTNNHNNLYKTAASINKIASKIIKDVDTYSLDIKNYLNNCLWDINQPKEPVYEVWQKTSGKKFNLITKLKPILGYLTLIKWSYRNEQLANITPNNKDQVLQNITYVSKLIDNQISDIYSDISSNINGILEDSLKNIPSTWSNQRANAKCIQELNNYYTNYDPINKITADFFQKLLDKFGIKPIVPLNSSYKKFFNNIYNPQNPDQQIQILDLNKMEYEVLKPKSNFNKIINEDYSITLTPKEIYNFNNSSNESKIKLLKQLDPNYNPDIYKYEMIPVSKEDKDFEYIIRNEVIEGNTRTIKVKMHSENDYLNVKLLDNLNNSNPERILFSNVILKDPQNLKSNKNTTIKEFSENNNSAYLVFDSLSKPIRYNNTTQIFINSELNKNNNLEISDPDLFGPNGILDTLKDKLNSNQIFNNLGEYLNNINTKNNKSNVVYKNSKKIYPYQPIRKIGSDIITGNLFNNSFAFLHDVVNKIANPVKNDSSEAVTPLSKVKDAVFGNDFNWDSIKPTVLDNDEWDSLKNNGVYWYKWSHNKFQIPTFVNNIKDKINDGKASIKVGFDDDFFTIYLNHGSPIQYNIDKLTDNTSYFGEYFSTLREKIKQYNASNSKVYYDPDHIQLTNIVSANNQLNASGGNDIAHDNIFGFKINLIDTSRPNHNTFDLYNLFLNKQEIIRQNQYRWNYIQENSDKLNNMSWESFKKTIEQEKKDNIEIKIFKQLYMLYRFSIDNETLFIKDNFSFGNEDTVRQFKFALSNADTMSNTSNIILSNAKENSKIINENEVYSYQLKDFIKKSLSYENIFQKIYKLSPSTYNDLFSFKLDIDLEDILANSADAIKDLSITWEDILKGMNTKDSNPFYQYLQNPDYIVIPYLFYINDQPFGNTDNSDLTTANTIDITKYGAYDKINDVLADKIDNFTLQYKVIPVKLFTNSNLELRFIYHSQLYGDIPVIINRALKGNGQIETTIYVGNNINPVSSAVNFLNTQAIIKRDYLYGTTYFTKNSNDEIVAARKQLKDYTLTIKPKFIPKELSEEEKKFYGNKKKREIQVDVNLSLSKDFNDNFKQYGGANFNWYKGMLNQPKFNNIIDKYSNQLHSDFKWYEHVWQETNTTVSNSNKVKLQKFTIDTNIDKDYVLNELNGSNLTGEAKEYMLGVNITKLSSNLTIYNQIQLTLNNMVNYLYTFQNKANKNELLIASENYNFISDQQLNLMHQVLANVKGMLSYNNNITPDMILSEQIAIVENLINNYEDIVKQYNKLVNANVNKVNQRYAYYEHIFKNLMVFDQLKRLYVKYINVFETEVRTKISLQESTFVPWNGDSEIRKENDKKFKQLIDLLSNNDYINQITKNDNIIINQDSEKQVNEILNDLYFGIDNSMQTINLYNDNGVTTMRSPVLQELIKQPKYKDNIIKLVLSTFDTQNNDTTSLNLLIKIIYYQKYLLDINYSSIYTNLNFILPFSNFTLYNQNLKLKDQFYPIVNFSLPLFIPNYDSLSKNTKEILNKINDHRGILRLRDHEDFKPKLIYQDDFVANPLSKITITTSKPQTVTNNLSPLWNEYINPTSETISLSYTSYLEKTMSIYNIIGWENMLYSFSKDARLYDDLNYVVDNLNQTKEILNKYIKITENKDEIGIYELCQKIKQDPENLLNPIFKDRQGLFDYIDRFNQSNRILRRISKGVAKITKLKANEKDFAQVINKIKFKGTSTSLNDLFKTTSYSDTNLNFNLSNVTNNNQLGVLSPLYQYKQAIIAKIYNKISTSLINDNDAKLAFLNKLHKENANKVRPLDFLNHLNDLEDESQWNIAKILTNRNAWFKFSIHGYVPDFLISAYSHSGGNRDKIYAQIKDNLAKIREDLVKTSNEFIQIWNTGNKDETFNEFQFSPNNKTWTGTDALPIWSISNDYNDWKGKKFDTYRRKMTGDKSGFTNITSWIDYWLTDYQNLSKVWFEATGKSDWFSDYNSDEIYLPLIATPEQTTKEAYLSWLMSLNTQNMVYKMLQRYIIQALGNSQRMIGLSANNYSFVLLENATSNDQPLTELQTQLQGLGLKFKVQPSEDGKSWTYGEKWSNYNGLIKYTGQEDNEREISKMIGLIYQNIYRIKDLPKNKKPNYDDNYNIKMFNVMTKYIDNASTIPWDSRILVYDKWIMTEILNTLNKIKLDRPVEIPQNIDKNKNKTKDD